MKNKDKTLRLRVERTSKTTHKDVELFYQRVYREAESLGFKVIHLEPIKEKKDE